MTIDDVKNDIESNDAVMLYFSGIDCGVCHALMPKIKDSFSLNYPRIKQVYIDASKFPEIPAHFSVFAVPTIIIFFEAKEFIRKSRLISVDELNHELQRPYSLFFN
jgi:thioredoxin-like negative regulator of GroEL